MPDIILILTLGFVFSFLGSIPPGTINISVLQLGLNHQMRGALFFTLAATTVEFFYAWIAVKFQIFLTESTAITQNFQFIAGAAMFVLGLINLSRKPSRQAGKFGEGRVNFGKGLVVSLLNPLAIPFWVAVTAYLQSEGFILLSSNSRILVYVLGICAGTFALLVLVAILSKKFLLIFQNSLLVYKLPGFIFIGMGLYTFWS